MLGLVSVLDKVIWSRRTFVMDIHYLVSFRHAGPPNFWRGRAIRKALPHWLMDLNGFLKALGVLLTVWQVVLLRLLHSCGLGRVVESWTHYRLNILFLTMKIGRLLGSPRRCNQGRVKGNNWSDRGEKWSQMTLRHRQGPIIRPMSWCWWCWRIYLPPPLCQQRHI